MVVLFGAIYYRRSQDNQLREQLDKVLENLRRAERKVSVPPRTRVAIGLGACQDGFVSAIDLLNKLEIKPPAGVKHYGSIQGEKELAEMFAFFFSRGAAGERYLHDKQLFEDILNVVEHDPSANWYTGGNAPAMANRLAKEGCEVLLGARMSQKLRDSLHERIKVVGSPLKKDDVHLLMEYKTGEQWGPYVTPRANRFIIHSDSSNPKLESLDDFSEGLLAFHPQAVVIGGLQMMDNFPFLEGERHSRLAELQRVMADLSPNTKTHFEFASFAEEAMLHDLLEYVVPYSDSLGMNEQELPNLFSLLAYGNVSVLSDPYPRTATVLDQMRFVFNSLKKTPLTDGRRKLSRLHVHTLAFQAIMTSKGSGWKNTMSAAAKAALTANRYVCGTSEVDISKSRIIMDDSFSISQEVGSQRMPFRDDRPVSCWDEDDVRICVAPVLVCTDVYMTGGGGDNVSSAGLVLQI